MGFSHARVLDDGRLVGGYATVWSVEDKGKYSNVQLSTSKRNEDGTYTTDFSGFVAFVGKAHTMAQGITEMTRIQIKHADVTKRYVKEQDKEYTNFAVFDFDFMSDAPKKSNTKKTSSKPKLDPIPEDVDDEMPFI